MSKIITSQRTESEAGYFRIGNIVLDIPPEQIQCHKVINSDEVLPLRFPFAMPIKTGQSRWDVTWTWKALADFDLQDYSQWQIVQKLLAMVKAAPFVEVENEHIRQIVNPATLTVGATNDDIMAFALKQMRVDTVPDMIDALQITMTMSLFFYRPFSKYFQYDAGAGVPASSALGSPLFDTYLNAWMQTNLSSEWFGLEPGVVALSCREYIACPLPYTLPNPQGGTNPIPANPGATQPGAATQGSQSNFVDNVIISPITSSNPQVQWWVTAVSSGESTGAGGYNAINFSTLTNSGKPSAAVGLLQWVRGSAIDAMKGSDSKLGTSYITTAVQNNYLVKSSSASNGYTWNANKSISNPKSSDPSLATYISWMQNPPISGGETQLQNDMATGWAILKLSANNGSVLKAWEAQYFGQGIVNNGQANPASQNTYFTKLVNSWRASSSNPQAFSPAANTTSTPQPITPAMNPTSTSGTNTNPTNNPTNSSTPATAPPTTYQIDYYLNQGYTYDYWTEVAAFLYKTHKITMTSLDPVFGTNPSCSDITDIDPQHFVNPNQISVVFANNIAQLPLSSYQYPTYQHLGPVSTLISIGLLSDAKILGSDTYAEPEHIGLSYISSLTDLLEKQFQLLRTEWRRVNSIQAMQAMFVQNQVLNLLGIDALLTKELTTETIPDSPNLVSAQYNAIQYENVFEELNGSDAFFANTVPAQFGELWDTVLRSGALNPYASDQSILTLTNLSNLMQNPTSAAAQSLLFDWMVGSPNLIDFLGQSWASSLTNPVPPTTYTIQTPTGFAFTGSEQLLMIKILEEAPAGTTNATGGVGDQFSFIQTYPYIGQTIVSHNPMNYSDFFMINNWVNQNPTLPDYATWQTTATTINNNINSAVNNQSPIPETPLNTLFDAYVANAYSLNLGNIQSQMQKAMTIPAINALFITPQTTATPGSPQGQNTTHGCYRDMGITQLQLGGQDYTPAVYFHDDSKDMNSTLQSQIDQIVSTTVTTAQNFANATPIMDRSVLMPSNTESFSTNVRGILSNVEVSAYSMSRAFPTFKLFLMEDNSLKPFYAFDKFYSYATVLDMEIIRYRDKPDTAIIQISNLMHLLDQHLYDTTPQGRQEARLNASIETKLNAGGSAMVSQGGVGGATINVDAFQIDNRFPQINPSGGDAKFPLSYFALQTGTKVQIRMGFSNIPDNLTPVFTGEVTDISGDEILTITAQSYMIELIIPTTDGIRHDGFAVDSFLNNMTNSVAKAQRDVSNFNLLAVATAGLSTAIPNIFGHSAAYGGGGTVGGVTVPGFITPGGGAQDVMSAMLHVSSAKHFGYWQWGATPDKYIKGFSFHTAKGSVLNSLSSSPLTKGATGLESGFDRSFENILTSHVFGPNGTATIDTDGSSRGWFYEKPAGYGAPEYFVPKDPNLTPWTLIQDVARRFPEFILAVKQYGFPYTADATLVFANPHDFYSSRSPIPSDVELQQNASNDDQTFNTWWTSGSNSGKTPSGKAQLTAFCNTLGANWVEDTVVQYQASMSTSVLGRNALSSTPNVTGIGLNSETNQLMSYITSASIFFTIVGILDSAIGSPSITNTLANTNQLLTFFLPTSPISRVAIQQNLEQIVQNYYNYYQLVNTSNTPNYSGARMKPVRKYHLINADNIVHNGIMLNEKFYNVVNLDGDNLMVNSAIAPSHQRLLNADSFIVSKDNIHNWPEARNAYEQTFLRDEVSKMYRGEIVLLGDPDIEPFDVLVINDPSMGISGPVEVDSVIHSFNQETGYITIVRPRAFVVINDLLSMSLYASAQQMLTQVGSIISGYIPGLTASGSVVGSVGAVTLDTAAAVVGGLAGGPWIAAAAALGGTAFIFWMGAQVQKSNPIGIAPLMRFERPWVGGIEGFQINDLQQMIATKWQYFKEDEIDNTLYSFRVAKGMGLIP